MMTIQAWALWGMGAVLFPLWLAAGFSDYLCHRYTSIETTSGLRESLFHLMLASLMGFGVLVLLVFEITALIAIVLTLLLLAHEAITQLDLRWAHGKRESFAVEQHTHSFLTAIPLAALALVWLVAAPAFSFALEFRREPIPWLYIAVILTAMTVFGAIPYWEEFWRCLRQSRRQMTGQQPSPAASTIRPTPGAKSPT